MIKVEYDDIMAFHPGYYIKEIIEEMELTQEEFAVRLGTSPKNLSELLAGKIKLSTDLASKLSIMLGTSIDVWLNLEKTFESKISEIEKKKKLDGEIEVLKEIDYNYFKEFGLNDTKSSEEKVANLCCFLNVASLTTLLKKDFLVNYRSGTNKITQKNIINSRAWLQTAINIGKTLKTDTFDKSKLEQYIPQIRRMTLSLPEQFIPELRSIFSSCGVAFVMLPNLKNCGVNGAVKWLNNRVILAINDRRLYADTFWFSLFHEIKHILQHKTKELIVSLDKKELETFDSKLEQEADVFAQNTLIPIDKYNNFLQCHQFTENSIINFAKSIGIHPGIVVGRLQTDGLVHFNQFHNLKQKYKIIIT